MRFLLEFAIASTIGVMVSGVFELNLGDSEVLTMFLVILCFGELAAGSRENTEYGTEIGFRRHRDRTLPPAKTSAA